jgi:hypothetical protein
MQYSSALQNGALQKMNLCMQTNLKIKLAAQEKAPMSNVNEF